MAKFNERFRGLRQAAGLSQADLSKQIKISKSSINLYERGEREPSIEKLEAIADYFNVDMDYLLGKSEYKNRYAWLNDAVSNNGKDIDLTLVAYRIRKETGVDPDTAMDKAEEMANYYIKNNNPVADPLFQRLTDNYNRMNAAGKGKLVSYSDDLAANPANTADEPRFRPQIAAEGGIRDEDIPMVTQADKEKAEDAMLRLKIREMFGDEDE